MVSALLSSTVERSGALFGNCLFDKKGRGASGGSKWSSAASARLAFFRFVLPEIFCTSPLPERTALRIGRGPFSLVTPVVDCQL